MLPTCGLLLLYYVILSQFFNNEKQFAYLIVANLLGFAASNDWQRSMGNGFRLIRLTVLLSVWPINK